MRPVLPFLVSAALALPWPALAQTAVPTQAGAKSAAKPAPRTAKPTKPTKLTKPAKSVEPTEPETLDPELLALAPRVLVGDSQCEFGRRISLRPHPTLAGRFLLESNGLKHVLTPMPTTTGVIRLEERRTGMVWLQVPIKSMLLDGKKGQRVADNCMHAAQTAEVESMRERNSVNQ